MKDEDNLFNHQAPNDASESRARVLLIMGAVVVLAGIVLLANSLYQNRDISPMETMGEKFRAKARTILDSNEFKTSGKGLDDVKNIAKASCIFAREIEYVKGNTPPEPRGIRAPPKMLTGEDVSKVMEKLGKVILDDEMLKPELKTTRFDQKTYSTVLGSILSASELKHLDEIRTRHRYFSKVTSALPPVEAVDAIIDETKVVAQCPDDFNACTEFLVVSSQQLETDQTDRANAIDEKLRIEMKLDDNFEAGGRTYTEKYTVVHNKNGSWHSLGRWRY